MTTRRPTTGTLIIDRALERFATAPSLSWPWKIVFSAVLAAAFISLRVLLGPIMGHVIGFSLLIPAVLLAGLGAGVFSALMTTIFCTVGMALLFERLSPAGGPIPDFWPPAISFWCISIVCGLVGASLRQSLTRLSYAHTDLAELMQVQRENNSQMRAMFEQASTGIARTDLTGLVLQANSRFLEIVGRSEQDVVGHDMTEFTHPDDRDMNPLAQTPNVEGEYSGWQMDKRYVRPDGSIAYALVSIRTLHHDDGPAYGYLVVVADITRTRMAEEALSESRHSFRSIADTIPVLIWLTGNKKIGRFVNKAYLDFTGQKVQDVNVDNWVSFLHPDDLERIQRTYAAGLASETSFTMEARYRRHDGQWRWLKTFHQPHLDSQGQKMGMVGTAFDMTESVEATTRLEESEARFRMVANSAPAMIWMVDEQGRTVFGNRRFRSAFSGRTPTRLTSAWRDMAHPEDRELLDKTLTEAQEHQRKFSILNRSKHPIFGERWIRTEAAPRHDSHGRLIGFTGVSLDVTESQRAEHDLKRINELLEERVSAALSEKAKAEADLVRSNRLEAVGRLTGGVAHDFNNLLTVIMGGLDIILRTDDPARRKKLGEAALAAAKRGEQLTSQLLAFSRRQPLSPSLIDLNALITEGEPLLYRAVGEGMSLQYKLKRGTATSLVDPAKFEAALINLLVNARDACDANGRIKVETADYRVEDDNAIDQPLNDNETAFTRPKARAEAIHPPDLSAGRYIRITVTDNGSGMSEDVQRRVFEPFFTTKGVGHGTGLGLSQVYGFTRQSGGSISIESAPGKGTKIHMFLPWSPEPEAQADTASNADSDTQDPVTQEADAMALRILLVEDDPEVSAIASALIIAEGYSVEHAENAPQALDLLQKNTYDVVLSDILMPGGMSGIELAHRIHQEWPELRVILSSGFPGEAEALKGTSFTFLPKPYTAAQLRAALLGT